MKDSKDSAIMFLIGIATGIAFSLLLAPRSGPRTRRIIVRKFKGSEAWVRAKAAAAKEQLRSSEAEVRDRADKVADVVGQA